MTQEKHTTPNPFDPKRFRMPDNSQQGPAAQKVLTGVPVRRPPKQLFIRVNPNPALRLECGLLELDGDPRPYLVLPECAYILGTDMKHRQLRLACDRQNNPFLWPVPLPPQEGHDNGWNISHRIVADMSETTWVRMVSNRDTGAYEAIRALGSDIPEPQWPELSLVQLLELAFGNSHVIDREEHPAVLTLRGAV